MFEKDKDVLKQALDEIEQRIKKLQEHKETERKQLRKDNDEVLRRLERNLNNLQKKRKSILIELESN